MVWLEDGKIKTDLCDISFIERVWQKWGGYSEGETEALMEGLTIEKLTDAWLMSEGVGFLSNPCLVEEGYLRLIKVGVKEWVIEDAEVFEMEQFVTEMC